jgi:hypothetical protein
MERCEHPITSQPQVRLSCRCGRHSTAMAGMGGNPADVTGFTPGAYPVSLRSARCLFKGVQPWIFGAQSDVGSPAQAVTVTNAFRTSMTTTGSYSHHRCDD